MLQQSLSVIFANEYQLSINDHANTLSVGITDATKNLWCPFRYNMITQDFKQAV